MIIEKPFDNEVIVVKNFISEEELEMLLKIAKNATKEDWSKLDSASRARAAKARLEGRMAVEHLGKSYDVYSIIPQKCNEITDRAYTLMKNEGLLDDTDNITGFRVITRIFSHGIPEHKDGSDKAPGQTPFGLVLYLNSHDVDFTGGELAYTKLGDRYQPRAGDLVIHPGTEKYSHKVEDVSSGVRYMLTSFIRKP